MQPNLFYHVYNKSIDDNVLFKGEKDYLHFTKLIKKYISPHSKIFAYCLIPNHFHLFIQIKSANEIKKKINPNIPSLQKGIDIYAKTQISHLLNAYSRWYNIKYERKGRLFIQSFKHKQVLDNQYFTQLIYYIHNNPLHHHLVKNILDWKYSSYHTFLSGKKGFIEKEEVLDWFGGLEHFKRNHALNHPTLSGLFHKH